MGGLDLDEMGWSDWICRYKRNGFEENGIIGYG